MFPTYYIISNMKIEFLGRGRLVEQLLDIESQLVLESVVRRFQLVFEQKANPFHPVVDRVAVGIQPVCRILDTAAAIQVGFKGFYQLAVVVLIVFH